jgi:hypothetical protein
VDGGARVAEANLLILDADLNKRLQTELNARGLAAAATSSLHLSRSIDEVLLARIQERYANTPFVLITADDHMLLEHASNAAGVTIAVVDPLFPDTYKTDAWRRDVVHRWAHSMRNQPAGDWVRYGLRRAKWLKPRHRKPVRI